MKSLPSSLRNGPLQNGFLLLSKQRIPDQNRCQSARHIWPETTKLAVHPRVLCWEGCWCDPDK